MKKYDFKIDVKGYNFRRNEYSYNTVVTEGDNLLELLQNAEVLQTTADGAIVGKLDIEYFDTMTILEMEGEIITAKRNADLSARGLS